MTLPNDPRAVATPPGRSIKVLAVLVFPAHFSAMSQLGIPPVYRALYISTVVPVAILGYVIGWSSNSRGLEDRRPGTQPTGGESVDPPVRSAAEKADIRDRAGMFLSALLALVITVAWFIIVGIRLMRCACHLEDGQLW
ncbi:uncharacterized protein E0L32_009923 [Thyridium curvatum]|uniref:Uncharacterized protein n=1 Tax=Thyridium curvatum TaxID=1093900 RepID=A0A507AQ17_9PEZI|nr:uncharacterized protein E0L32_009923 [Thyridium curvatum]TPX08584.1 hypothetical protein E0L32_009923 [Thyridium curvatum]